MIGLAARHDPPLQRRSVDLMLLALAVALLPHLTHLPLTVVLFCIAFATWRWMAAHRDWSLPGMPVRTLLTIIALSGVFLSFGTVFGRDAGAALLVIMLGLKLLEVRRHRDAVIVLYLGYFLTVTMVLFSQEIVTIVGLAIALLLITAALFELNHPAQAALMTPLGLRLRRSGTLLLQALPLMLIMFLLFPRLPSPLWNLPDDAYSGMTGLSDSMSPGSISDLGQSDSVAFRVAFDGAMPAPELLYWRGPVFWHTDGRTWSPDAGQAGPILLEQPAFEVTGAPLGYTVTLEPHNRRWLFALEMPYTIPDDSRHSADLLLFANQPVRHLTRYRVDSHTNYRANRMNALERTRALQLPTANPRARALGGEWRRRYADHAAIVQHALDHFRNEPFHYTLTPTLLPGNDPVDDFLFGTRRGFCEHYAAAFTVIMRAAGIPARVVTGYQGGEINPIGDYLIVRQRDAHAWSEVWLDGAWVRIDPTAAVAPHRIERGSSEALRDERSAMRNSFERGMLGAMWRQAGFGWDTLNNRWNLWVLGYGPDNQIALLSRFGLRSWTGMMLAMLAMLGVVLFVTAAVLTRRRADGDPVRQLYERFCAKLARRGIARAPSEGPAVFAARASDQRPDLAAAIASINRRYIAMRYGGIATSQQLRRLRREIALFKP